MVQPTPNPCAEVDCSDNGECVASNGAATCECDEGYGGPFCESCDEGFEDQGGSCVASVVTCADITCGTNEVCDDATVGCVCAEGTVGEPGACVLDCEVGFTGADCTDCAEGYFPLDDACQRNVPCEEVDPCGDNGTCANSDSGLTCACEAGYEGSRCDNCTATHFRENDTCIQREICAADSCNSRGTCDDSSGRIDCTCDAIFGGERCRECYPGYVALGDTCVIAETCQAGTCFGNGTCDDTTGFAVCTCDFGYRSPFCDDCAVGHTGAACETCLPGYTLIGDTCTAACADSLYVAEGEVCEDGNTDPSNGSTDFCSSDCSFTNWPDGEWPGFIPATPSNAWLSWNNTQIDGNASRYRIINAGAQFTVAGQYAYNASATGCVGCVNQLYIGVFAKDDMNMDPLNKQKQFCVSFNSSLTNTFNTTLTAPSEPGTYYVRWARGWNFSCDPAMGDWGAGANLFAIYVPAPM